jgi:hypothetical protein
MTEQNDEQLMTGKQWLQPVIKKHLESVTGERLLTGKEASELAGVNYHTFCGAVFRKKMPAVRSRTDRSYNFYRESAVLLYRDGGCSAVEHLPSEVFDIPDNDLKRCSKCRRVLHLSAFSVRKKDGRPARYCKECESAYQKQYRVKNWGDVYSSKVEYAHRVREEGIAALGGKCACCGETINEFITLDHINGRTEEDYHSGGLRRTGKAAWMKARSDGWDTGKYQILCYNCNCAKGAYGTCPHTWATQGGDAK